MKCANCNHDGLLHRTDTPCPCFTAGCDCPGFVDTEPTAAEAIDPAARLCTCCANTEHTADQGGRPWIEPHPGTGLVCRRCSGPCDNFRCDQLPTNPDGRGYGARPRRVERTLGIG